jgi:two-component system, LytTR family, response regulator
MNQPISCIIMDDDETSRFILTNLVKKNPALKLIKSCSNALEARELLENRDVDLILLDIEMPYESGMDMFQKLTSKPMVIFITSQTKHAIKAFEIDAIDYIVKPVDLKRLVEATDKVERRLASVKGRSHKADTVDEFIFIKKNRETFKLLYSNIIFIEGSSSYITYHTIDGKITTTGILKQIESELDPEVFVRVHRSYIINIRKVTKINSQELKVRDVSVPLSRKYKKKVSEIFLTSNTRID